LIHAGRTVTFNKNGEQENMKTSDYPLTETLSEPSAAKVLGISQMSLRRERNRGNISYYKVGRRVLYTPGQIADYLSSVERKRNGQGVIE